MEIALDRWTSRLQRTNENIRLPGYVIRYERAHVLLEEVVVVGIVARRWIVDVVVPAGGLVGMVRSLDHGQRASE